MLYIFPNALVVVSEWFLRDSEGDITMGTMGEWGKRRNRNKTEPPQHRQDLHCRMNNERRPERQRERERERKKEREREREREMGGGQKCGRTVRVTSAPA